MAKTEGMLSFFKGNGMTVLKITPFSAAEFYFYEVYKGFLYPGKEKNQLGYGPKLICGSLTGITASFLTYPLDLVKTYLTVNTDNAQKVNFIEQTRIIVRQHGVLGLYKGLGASLIGIGPFIGVKMSSFDWMMANFGPEKGSRYIVYYNLIIGALAGTAAVTVTYPTDLVRKLVQLNGQPGHNYTGLADACGQLWAKEGFMGFYKGLWATYLKVAPMTAILFLTNESLKRHLKIS